jgi:hypothetical protein
MGNCLTECSAVWAYNPNGLTLFFVHLLSEPLFPLNPNCFHLDFGVATHSSTMNTLANHANPEMNRLIQSLVGRQQ